MSQIEKPTVHRIITGTKCSNREDCPCGPTRVEGDDKVYWIHQPVVALFGPHIIPLNELPVVVR